VQIDLSSADKGSYTHYMLKEIHEQPFVLAKLFMEYYDVANQQFVFPISDLRQYKRIYLVACGTSFHAASVAKYWFEKFAGIAVEIDLASELRYRHSVLDKDAISIFLSQSGETADTVAAMRHMNACGLKTLALVNVADSTIAREADAVLPLMCGYEIGVASTKVFSAQLLMLAMLCLSTAHKVGNITDEQLKAYAHNMHNLPEVLHRVFQTAQQVQMIASSIKDASSMIYIGRGISFPLALEGALKIKEVSYIHAEGIAAGELKHGSIALIDENIPIIAVAPCDEVFHKLVSNIQEVVARKGVVISVTEEGGVEALAPISRFVVEVPSGDDFTSAIICSVPLQLLAYYTAVALDKNVDQPRNLAKSVTVE
jgi:glucosamine--fructose-6-phosphate aminotransferase (isomerizing)